MCKGLSLGSDLQQGRRCCRTATRPARSRRSVPDGRGSRDAHQGPRARRGRAGRGAPRRRRSAAAATARVARRAPGSRSVARSARRGVVARRRGARRAPPARCGRNVTAAVGAPGRVRSQRQGPATGSSPTGRRSTWTSSTRCSTKPSRRCRTSPSSATTRRSRLWRGPPFGEFTDEWWALPESIAAGRASASSLEEQRAASLMAIGHHNRAIPDLERLVVEHPLRERPVRLLMQALHATGRRAEALRAAGRSEPGSPRRPGSSHPASWSRSRRRCWPATKHRSGRRESAAARLHDPRGDRRGRPRSGVRGHPARHRAPGGDQGDPTRPRRLDRVHPPLRGRGPARRPARAPAHRPALRLLARAGRRLPRVPPPRPAARPGTRWSPAGLVARRGSPARRGDRRRA